MALGGGKSGKASPDAVKAGETFVEATLDDSKFRTTLANLGKRIQGIGGSIRNIGLGMAGFGTAALAPIVALTKGAADYSEKIQDAVDRTGGSAEAISRLSFAAEMSDTNLDGVVKTLTMLNKAAFAAMNGSEAQKAAFDALGISAQDFLKLDADEKFRQLASAFDKVADGGQRAYLLMNLMGKSATEVLPMLAGGVEGLDKWLNKSDEIGRTISGETAQRGAQIKDVLDTVTNGFKMTFLEIGAALFGFSDIMESGGNSINEFFAKIREFIKENAVIIRSVVLLGGAFIGLGITLAITGVAISGFITILGLLKVAVLAVIALFTSPWVAAVAVAGAAIGGLTYAFLEFTETGQQVKSDMTEAWDSISETFHTAYEGIVAAIAKGDFSLAWKIAWTGVRIIWNEGILFLTKQWNKLKAFFIDGADDIWLGIREGFWNLIAWIMRKASEAVSFITRNLADALELAGADETAAKLRNLNVVSPEDINRGRDNIINEMRDRRAARQRDRDEARARDEKEIADRIKELKDELKVLVDRAVAKPSNAPFGSGLMQAGIGIFMDQMLKNWKYLTFEDPQFMGLGRAVRGAFGSRDYQGAFGIGPAEKVQKDQLATQKEMLKELKNLNGKAGPLVFE